MRHILALTLVVLWACGGEDEAATEGDGAAVADSTAADSTLADSAAADSALAKKKADAIPVEIAAANVGSISSYLVFNSTVETEESVQVFPQISGLVERIVAEEGDRVEVGDTLLAIEDDQLRIAYKEAKVNFEFQETNFRRNEAMFKRKLISDQDYDTKRFELEQARLRYDRAQLELEHSVIVAPFSGVITDRFVQVGARVGSGTHLYDLIKLEDMIARVFVPGQYLAVVAKKQQAVVESDFLPGKTFEGWVKRISPVVDPRSGTFKVTVGLRDRFEHLRPGIFVNVRIVTDTHETAVLIPKQAIVYDGGDQYVFAVRDTIAQRIALSAGYEDSRHIEALTDIDPGTPIIIVGQNGLKDGARVRIVNQPEGEDADGEITEGEEGELGVNAEDNGNE
ncbi:MAG: membrane fusion protein (multidrug efflux system) [Candidatus Latescibacterota bacterium]|jgi:membrane fusion protein (multidrug efflux system)